MGSEPRLPQGNGPLALFSRYRTIFAIACVIVAGLLLAQMRSGTIRKTKLPKPMQSFAALVEPVFATEPEAAPMPVTLETRKIGKRETMSEALLSVGFTGDEVNALVKAAKPFANLGRVRQGDELRLFYRPDLFGESKLASFQLSIAENKTLLARPTGKGGFTAEVSEIPYETKLVGYVGTVQSTLWEAAVDAGMKPELIDELADVFAFSIDFTREVRLGDKWRVVVEQKLLEGRPSGYGRILAAEYVNGKESHSAIHYENGRGDVDYFSTDGGSLRRMFLRSPLKYSRITSRFGTRWHPVHKTRKAHQGVDYGASKGTPVRSVGDGTVIASSWNGGSGNFVKIRHNGTYETSYSHLSGYGPGIKKGVRVKQGQLIGYVGSTGISTGPHLHFAFYEGGRYIDPLSKRFPAAEPVPTSEKERFEKAKAELLPLLPQWPEAQQATAAAKTMPVAPAVAAPLAASR